MAQAATRTVHGFACRHRRQDGGARQAGNAAARKSSAALARRKSNGILRRAIKAWQRGDIVRAGQLALKATDADDTNAKAFHVLGMALERMGHLHKALVTYERAFQLDPEDPELLINLGLTAWNLKQTDGAAQDVQPLHRRLSRQPARLQQSGQHPVRPGLARTARSKPARRDLSHAERSRFCGIRLPPCWPRKAAPRRAWSSITKRSGSSPNFARLHHNLGYAYSHLGQLDEALAAYDQALDTARRSSRADRNHAFARICLIGMGKLEEGFREFEIRNNPRFRAYLQSHDQGAAVEGRGSDGQAHRCCRRAGPGRRIHVRQHPARSSARGRRERQARRSPSIRAW